MNEVIPDAGQLIVTLGLAVIIAYFVGRYLAHLIRGTTRPFERYLARLERAIFRLCGIDPNRPMDWKEYTVALVLLNLVFAAFTFLVLVVQGSLPSIPGSSLASPPT